MNGDTNTCLGICQPSQFSDYVSARPISTSRAVLRIPLGRSSRPHSEAVSRVSSTTTPRPPRTTFRPSTRLWTQSSNSATRSDLPSLLPTLGEPTLRFCCSYADPISATGGAIGGSGTDGGASATGTAIGGVSAAVSPTSPSWAFLTPCAVLRRCCNYLCTSHVRHWRRRRDCQLGGQLHLQSC